MITILKSNENIEQKLKQILVLTEKGIEEQGSHKELIQKGGIYAKYYEMYQ